jgi:hypothetical protein
MTVQLSEYFLFEKGGTESLPKVFLHDNCEQIFFCLLTKIEMRSGTHFTQWNLFLPVVARRWCQHCHQLHLPHIVNPWQSTVSALIPMLLTAVVVVVVVIASTLPSSSLSPLSLLLPPQPLQSWRWQLSHITPPLPANTMTLSLPPLFYVDCCIVAATPTIAGADAPGELSCHPFTSFLLCFGLIVLGNLVGEDGWHVVGLDVVGCVAQHSLQHGIHCRSECLMTILQAVTTAPVTLIQPVTPHWKIAKQGGVLVQDSIPTTVLTRSPRCRMDLWYRLGVFRQGCRGAIMVVIVPVVIPAPCRARRPPSSSPSALLRVRDLQKAVDIAALIASLWSLLGRLFPNKKEAVAEAAATAAATTATTAMATFEWWPCNSGVPLTWHANPTNIHHHIRGCDVWHCGGTCSDLGKGLKPPCKTRGVAISTKNMDETVILIPWNKQMNPWVRKGQEGVGYGMEMDS